MGYSRPLTYLALTSFCLPEVDDVGVGIVLAERLDLAPLLNLCPGQVRQIRHPKRTNVPLKPPSPTLGEHYALVRRWFAHSAAPLQSPSDHAHLPN